MRSFSKLCYATENIYNYICISDGTNKKNIFNPLLIMATMEQNNIEEIRKKAERFESQYNKLRQEFKDYIETSRRNEETKRQELKTDSAKKLLVVADSLSRISASYDIISCDVVKSY